MQQEASKSKSDLTKYIEGDGIYVEKIDISKESIMQAKLLWDNIFPSWKVNLYSRF